MRHHGVRLPMLGVRMTLAICGCLVVACVCVGLAMRASLTSYANDEEAVAALPFVVSSRASEEKLRLRTPEEIASAVAEAGLDEEALAEGDAGLFLGMASKEALGEAPAVLTATFSGRRSYVYQAFQCHVEVTSVLRGEGVSVGDDLVVYDAYEIKEPLNGTGMGQFSGAREVWSASSGPGQFGLTPMREGQEYLLFLEPKAYPREKDSSAYMQTYCLITHPYARISLDIAEHPERVGVFALPSDGQWQRIPFAEACQYDIAVTDEAAKEAYLESCESLLADALRGG